MAVTKRNKDYYCVIMAGGIGSRFWPMSRSSHPKQFLDILGTGKTLIQQTFERFLNVCPAKNILVVTNAAYADLVQEQLPDILPEQIISEPARRNTAPCITYAAYKIAKSNPNAVMVVAPSDHLVLKEDKFARVTRAAMKSASTHEILLTLGIKPSRPDTGYGYIQSNEHQYLEGSRLIRKVKTFTEKPDLDMAKFFLQSGDFYWNSGIFVWGVQAFLKAMDKYLPEVNSLFKAGKDKYNTSKEQEFVTKTYAVCTNISIDYGLMEKAENVYMIPAEFGWSDLGTWGSLYDNLRKNGNGNAIIGKNVMVYDSSNCIVNVPKEKLVVLQGLEDYIVSESDNILLICKKEDEQKIKQFVNDIRIEKGDEFV